MPIHNRSDRKFSAVSHLRTRNGEARLSKVFSAAHRADMSQFLPKEFASPPKCPSRPVYVTVDNDGALHWLSLLRMSPNPSWLWILDEIVPTEDYEGACKGKWNLKHAARVLVCRSVSIVSNSIALLSESATLLPHFLLTHPSAQRRDLNCTAWWRLM